MSGSSGVPVNWGVVCIAGLLLSGAGCGGGGATIPVVTFHAADVEVDPPAEASDKPAAATAESTE